MTNPNPKLENLTRAGKGQPLKGLATVQVNLSPELLATLERVCTNNNWKRNYLIEQSLRVLVNLPADYSLDELIQKFEREVERSPHLEPTV